MKLIFISVLNTILSFCLNQITKNNNLVNIEISNSVYSDQNTELVFSTNSLIYRKIELKSTIINGTVQLKVGIESE